MSDEKSIIPYQPFNFLEHFASQQHPRDLYENSVGRVMTANNNDLIGIGYLPDDDPIIDDDNPYTISFSGNKGKISFLNSKPDMTLHAGNATVSVCDIASVLPDIIRLLPWMKKTFRREVEDCTRLPRVLWDIVKCYLNDDIY